MKDEANKKLDALVLNAIQRGLDRAGHILWAIEGDPDFKAKLEERMKGYNGGGLGRMHSTKVHKGRLIDLSLQRLRKAGKITHDSPGGWREVKP